MWNFHPVVTSFSTEIPQCEAVESHYKVDILWKYRAGFSILLMPTFPVDTRGSWQMFYIVTPYTCACREKEIVNFSVSLIEFGHTHRTSSLCPVRAKWRMSDLFIYPCFAPNMFIEADLNKGCSIFAKMGHRTRACSTISHTLSDCNWCGKKSHTIVNGDKRKVETQYLDTLHQFHEAEKHFFVCPKAGTQHIPDNPPHSWPVVATCRHLDTDGLTSSLRCIEAHEFRDEIPKK